MKYVVTRDQATEHNMPRTDIAIWEEGAFDFLSMNSDGEWGASGALASSIIDEMTDEEFVERYELAALDPGLKVMMESFHTWVSNAEKS